MQHWARRDFVGERFGDLTVVAELERSSGNRRFLCICTCGKNVARYVSNLTQGKAKSCGCKYVDGRRGRKGREAAWKLRRDVAEMTDDGRRCLTCDTWKPWSRFALSAKNASRHASNCMDCARSRSVKSMYGVTREEFEWLTQLQGNVCALCEQSPTGGRKRLAVDHDHSCCGTKKGCKMCIRGLLCIDCNLLLGYAEKTEANRLRFADYLKQRPFVELGYKNG